MIWLVSLLASVLLSDAKATAVEAAAAVPGTGTDVLFDPLVISWAVGLLVAHVIVQALLGVVDSPFRAKPGVAAHQLVALVPFCYAAYHGTLLWLFDEDIRSMHAGDYTGRLYMRHEGSWALTRFMVGFQMYDLMSTALEPSLRKAEHLAHHSCTLLTAMGGAAFNGPYFPYYSAFFFGFTELSSVPLAFVDLFRQLPTLAKQFPAMNELVRTVFALTFLFVRVGWFPWVMLSRWWPDLMAAWAANDIRCPMHTYWWMAFSSTFLTFLQLFWGYKILRVVLKGNLGGKDANAAKSEAD